MITAHTIVKNEEQWVWYAINSVLGFVDKIIIFDTGSQDHTVNIIKSIESPKIEFEEKGKVSPRQLVDLRNEQIVRTKTDWFLVLDGDEVWPDYSIKLLLQAIKNAPEDKMAIIVRTRNCVQDIFHYLPESKGHYRLLGMEGHLNIRAFRVSKDFSWIGNYPLESYSNKYGPINNQNEKLIFLDTYYWHLTHLKRSTVKDSFKKNKKKYEAGILLENRRLLPEVFFAKRPEIVPSPILKPSLQEAIVGRVLTPIIKVKDQLQKI